MKVLFENPLFDAQLLRALAHAYYGGADVGECLSTAQRIREDDFDSWYDEWYQTADRLYAAAEAEPRRRPVGERPRGLSARLQLLPHVLHRLFPRSRRSTGRGGIRPAV